MRDELRSILLGTSGLGALLLVAAALTLTRRPGGFSAEARAPVLRLVGLAIVAQGAHFGEELLTGFQRLFPAGFGLAPWPTRLFVGFNAAWIAIWIASALALRAGSGAALLALWFLALALVANGLAHPLLSLRQGGYFPGLLTSPLVGFLGILLLARLRTLTAEPARAPESA
jgi:hypothetical protein